MEMTEMQRASNDLSRLRCERGLATMLPAKIDGKGVYLSRHLPLPDFLI
ncbi:hypothetical protein [Thalassococcus lentus]|uniref:Uncharacterized protein n=1 Tax=Thalassococcus lentus TaxID=1210524 RepID=A0ABT4XNN9_9RHOB|nr:hypothetical protein [Thalassococcus lentus]MDA7423554.1 hypothetical protein [Thalassococcus lentus]